jgi:transcriptional regulator with XRE-family HTH domain
MGRNMITRIREVRRAKSLTLLDVAERCKPPTTAQTIGRLETGTRTVSVGWLNRIAAALEVTAGDLVQLPGGAELPVAALIGPDGAHAPTREAVAAPPAVEDGMIAVQVDAAIGEYRSGDTLWCRRVAPDDFAQLLNRDVLVPRPAGRFIFGRCINRDGTMLQILPPGAGSKQQVVADPPWAAYATKLVRTL